MKKVLFTSLIVLCLAMNVQAQWLNNGDNYKTGRLTLGTGNYWAPLTIYSRANTNKNEGVAIAFEGTGYADIGYRFKANGTNYYQVLYNGNHIQWKHYNGTDYIPKMSLSNSGKLGLGVATPSSTLDLVGSAISGGESLLNLKVSDASNDYFNISNATGSSGQFIPMIQGYRDSDNRYSMMFSAITPSSNDHGSIPLMSFDARIRNINGAQSTIATRPLFQWNNFTTTHMTMLANGSLGLGTKNPGSHKLAVEGSIGARMIVCDPSGGWADFVFDPDYQLPTLEAVEQHIAENGHLPEIPSEKEVLDKGINLGEMDAKLLQKIEELTLYMIQSNKRMNKLEQENAELKATVRELKSK